MFGSHLDLGCEEAFCHLSVLSECAREKCHCFLAISVFISVIPNVSLYNEDLIVLLLFVHLLNYALSKRPNVSVSLKVIGSPRGTFCEQTLKLA